MRTKYAEAHVTSTDKIAAKVGGMSRSQLKCTLLSIRNRFRLDLTEEFLESVSRDRLRHMLLNALLKMR